jgi:hypothetical protein
VRLTVCSLMHAMEAISCSSALGDDMTISRPLLRLVLPPPTALGVIDQA